MDLIALRPETRQALQDELKTYLLEEHDIEIGDLKATLMLDHILEQIGPAIYNQALADLQGQVTLKLSDAIDALYKQAPAKGR
jgi:uncharacterized protein (DUF2164 family)